MIITGRAEAHTAGPSERSVRLRVAVPLPAQYRLLWLGAYADHKLGLNNLVLGAHRIDVEMHVVSADAGDAQMLRLAGGADVRLDGSGPVVLDVAVARASGPMPLSLTVGPALRTPGLAAPTGAAGSQAMAALARNEAALPALPQPLAGAGLPADIQLELCFDETGLVRRVDPLAWPHPRYLGAFIDGLRRWKTEPYQQNGKPTAFCVDWRQSLQPAGTNGG